jgi:spore coat protein CotF
MDPFIGDFECFTDMNETIVYCNTCNQNVNFMDKQCLKRHLTTNNYFQNLTGTSNHSFYEDLCESFISANIPLKKLNNPSLRNFLAKYTKQNILDESTITKYYVSKQYEKVMMTIKSQIKDKTFGSLSMKLLIFRVDVSSILLLVHYSHNNLQSNFCNTVNGEKNNKSSAT